ncbi:NXPE family member 3-like [Diadema setosum]|uniref:NXPE family member 3-like n=1 Tax=Diadema setosum TaxID=31175 RepID=UPI003B3B2860
MDRFISTLLTFLAIFALVSLMASFVALSEGDVSGIITFHIKDERRGYRKLTALGWGCQRQGFSFFREDTESKHAEAVVQTVRTVPHPFCPARNVSTKSMRFKEYATRQNISWQNVTDVTSGKLSSFTVRPKHREFQVCDQLELVIQARNGLNQTKSYGGDYFRARIFTKNQTFAASSSTDGEVIDHDNGTYSALFTLKWSGVVNIEVTLVHPSEAVHVLQQVQTEGFVEAQYLGGFRVTANSSHVEATLCDSALQTQHGPLCNFTDANSGSPWFCVKPQNLSCEHWFGHRARGSLMKETRFNDKHSIQPFKK